MYPYQYNYQQAQIIKVNGEESARQFQMMPNSSTLLLDEREPIVYLVQTDGAGYKTVMSYKITPINIEKKYDSNDIDKHLHNLEEKLNKLEELMTNAQSNHTSNAKQ